MSTMTAAEEHELAKEIAREERCLWDRAIVEFFTEAIARRVDGGSGISETDIQALARVADTLVQLRRERFAFVEPEPVTKVDKKA